MKTYQIFLLAALTSVFVAKAQSWNTYNVDYIQFPSSSVNFDAVDITCIKEDPNAIGFSLNKTDKITEEKEHLGERPLFPKFVKIETGKEKLKLEIRYAPDELTRPMQPQAINGVYKVPVKTPVSMTLSDVAGKILLEKDFGIYQTTVYTSYYINEQKSGVGSVKLSGKNEISIDTYTECARYAAIETAWREICGQYGMDYINTDMLVATVKDKSLKDSKEVSATFVNTIQNKAFLTLNDSEKETIKGCIAKWENAKNHFQDEKGKQLWGLDYNLALAYLWIEDQEAATPYYNSFLNQVKESIEKVNSFGKAGGAKAYTGKDIKYLAAYNWIRPFYEHYNKGLKEYDSFLKCLANFPVPFKKMTVNYTLNDLFSQRLGLEFLFPFFETGALKGDVKSIKGHITRPDWEEPIEFASTFENNKLIESEVKQGKLTSEKLYTIFDHKGEPWSYSSEKKDARNNKRILKKGGEYTSGMDRLTSAKANFGDPGLLQKKPKFGQSNSQLAFDLNCKWFLTSNLKYVGVHPIFKDLVTGNKGRFQTSVENAVMTATYGKSNMIENYVLTSHVKMEPYKLIENKKDETFIADVKNILRVVEYDENMLPKKMLFNVVATGETYIDNLDWGALMRNAAKDLSIGVFKTSLQTLPNGDNPSVKMAADEIVNQTINFESGYNVDGNNFTVNINEIWDCSYEFDKNGNWTEIKIGPYTYARTIK